jgi:hypothetical protein
MRSRETTAKPLRSTRRCSTEVGGGDGGEGAVKRAERRAAPLHSTFRRVAVFVPFSASGAPRSR